MLARLRMTIPQCLEIYRQVGNDLFGHRRNTLPLATKYHEKPLEKAVQAIVSQYCKHHENCDGDDWHPWSVAENKSVGSLASESEGGQPDRICQSYVYPFLFLFSGLNMLCCEHWVHTGV